MWTRWTEILWLYGCSVSFRVSGTQRVVNESYFSCILVLVHRINIILTPHSSPGEQCFTFYTWSIILLFLPAKLHLCTLMTIYLYWSFDTDKSSLCISSTPGYCKTFNIDPNLIPSLSSLSLSIIFKVIAPERFWQWREKPQ